MSTDELTKPLSRAELADLADREAQIEEDREAVARAYRRTGENLRWIRDARLYRDTHGSFEDYCRDRWAMSGSRAYQLIDGSALASTIVEMGAEAPRGESQARPLVGLPAEVAQEVWREASAEAGTPQPTARIVRQIADRFRSQMPPSPKLQALLKDDPHPSPDTLAEVFPEMVMERSATMLRLPRTELDRLNELVRRRGYPSFQEYALSLVNADIKKHLKGERLFQSTADWVETCNLAVETLERQKAAQAETFKRTADQILAQGGGVTASSKRRAKQ